MTDLPNFRPGKDFNLMSLLAGPHDGDAKAVVDGIRALKALMKDGDPQCKCAVCSLIRASARLADDAS